MNDTAQLRTVSYGGGVQSTALLVLAAQRRIDFSSFLFANTGEDSEHPDTLAYVRDVAMPYAAEHGIEIVELHRRRRDGTIETLMERLMAGSLAIPVRRTADGPPMSRSCTVDFKVRVIGKELKRRGATETDPAQVAIGISVDEIERAKPGIDPRSPYHPRRSWSEIRRDDPERFDAVAKLESDMNEVRVRLGKPPFWWTSRQSPMPTHIHAAQDTLPGFGVEGPEECDSGHCWT